jgi:tetratricopeptide (TPR) repeat protein
MESLHNLQTTYAYLRQYIKRQMWDEALEKQLTAVTLLTRHKFSKNYLVEYWETLAGLLCATRRNVLAFPIFEETIAIRIQRFGSNHPSLATTYFNMGTCKFQAQMYPQAVQDLKKCLDVLDDSNVPSTDETRLRAATFYKEANDVIQRLQRPPAVQESNYYYNEKEL